MTNYKKPEIIANTSLTFENISASSGEPTPVSTCWKKWNRYNVDWVCKGNCKYYKHVSGWGFLNDICTLA